MAAFVLVHGMWSQAAHWRDVAFLLRKQGHSVIAPDLPGHGLSAESMESQTLQAYTLCVSEIVKAQSSRVILVGQSTAGVVISNVAERHPERIEQLVYLGAYMLPAGQSVLGFTQNSPGEKASLLAKAVTKNMEKTLLWMPPAAFVNIFCADAAPEIAHAALASNAPEALKPLQGTVEITAERWGRICRTYICTSKDRALTLASQQEMIKGVGANRVERIHASHLAMLTQPLATANALHHHIGTVRHRTTTQDL